jgi:Tol biopolymer transport system component
MPLTSGTRVGPCTVLGPLGAGGMGEVYRATDTTLKRDVALKVLPAGFARDPDRMARFQREAEVLASFNHPNIAAIYGLAESGDVRALVLELVEGATLADRIAQGPITVDDALLIGRQIAEALEYAHERNIVHRDLKPANVKIRPDGRVKVLDFGLAKALASHAACHGESSEKVTSPATAAGVILGTAAYMSPEQAKGREVDCRTDTWSFGVVLLELLTGERPYRGDTISETLASIIRDEPDFTKLPESTPSEIRRLLRRSLDKDPRRRLQAIGEGRIAIEDALAGAPREEVGTVPGLRKRALPWAIAAVAAIVAGIGWVGVWRTTRPAQHPLTRFSADLGASALPGQNATAAISPDGTRIVFPNQTSDGKRQLATRLLDQADVTPLAGTDNGVEPFFSPDGKWIGFFADGKMKKISVQGGAVVTLCNASLARGATWGEDGSIIFMPTAGAFGLSRVSAQGGTPEVLTKPGDTSEATHRWPQILPGGNAVLFTASRAVGISYEDATIDVLSLKTGEVKVVHRGGYFGRYVPGGYLLYLHQGTLFGVRFDLERLEVRGTPVPLLEDVAGNAGTAGGQFDFSQNGTFVYLNSNSAATTWPILWLEGSGKTQPLLAAPGRYFTPRLSPDGNRLALSIGLTDLHVYDWARDTMTRLTFTTERTGYPVWTPDGTHIAFESQTSEGSSLNWIRADGSGEARRLLASKNELRPYSFTPDGKRLAFVELKVDTSTALSLLPIDTSDPDHPKPGAPEGFLTTGSMEGEPAFSVDGRWIAYVSDELGRADVYVRPFPHEGGSGKWQVSTDGGRTPLWSRNGREFFYESLDNRIMVAAYTIVGNSFTVDKPRVWSDTQIFRPNAAMWNLDLAPDGKRFAVLPPPKLAGDQKGSVHVTFVLNFFDELRRRIPPSN